MTSISIDFVVMDHPFLGYREEDRLDLEHAWGQDIQHGAFMGDVVLTIGDADFGTVPANRGWRGLVEWCLSLDGAARDVVSGELEYQLTDPDSNEYVQIVRDGQDLVFWCTWSDDVGRVEADVFVETARAFIARSVAWISENYPGAVRNMAASYMWERLLPYLDGPPW